MGDTKKIASAAVSPISAIGNLFESSQINPQQLDPLRPEYKGLASDLGTYGRSLVGRTATPYTGNLTAPLSTGESNILSLINKISGGDGANMPGLGSMAFGDQRSSLISDILSGKRMSPGSNPYLQDYITSLQRSGQDTLGRNLNLLDAAFGGRGMTGASSGRSTEAANAARLATADTNSLIAQILGNQYNQGLNEQMNVLGSVLPNLDSYTTNMLFSALGANALPRSIQQSSLTNQYNEFLRQLNEPLQNVNLAAQILGSAPGFQYMQPQYAPSKASQILGALGSVGQAALPFVLM